MAFRVGYTFPKKALLSSKQRPRVEHQQRCYGSGWTQIQGRMVLDATGHARKLVEYDKPFDPGYQVL